MRSAISIVFASVLTILPAHAHSDTVQRGPIPDWVQQSVPMPVPKDVSGLAFVRRQDTLIHLDELGHAQFFGYRIKILHPNALQLGNLSITWNPGAGPPIVHTIKIYREGETIDLLEKASFEILRREDQLEAAVLNGDLTAVLHVPDLRVGDELEVNLTTRASDPTLGEKNSGLLLLSPDPAPGRFLLGLSWTKGQKPHIKMTPDMSAVAKEGERELSFRFDNPGVLAPPKDAPARYRWQRVVEFSDFSSWAEISRHFAPLYSKAAKLSDKSPLKQEVGRIVSASASPLDRASAALKLVQENVRYIYVGLDGGNLTPAAADDTWQRRYGDCKGKTALLLALLSELDIEAEPVLANSAGLDDGLDERLPNPTMFDHVLVRARIGGKVYWLDGTLPSVALPSTHPAMPFRRVLPLTSGGSDVEHLGWKPSTKPNEITLFEIDARAGFDEPARITSTTIIRGLKGLQQQIQLSALTPGQLLDGMRQQAIGNTWQAIDQTRWHYDQRAQASILTISGTGLVHWEDDGDGARSLALPGGGFSPPERRVRSAEQDQNAPFYNEPDYNCYVTTVRLPVNTRSKQWSSKPGYDNRIFGWNYYRAFALRDGTIRMVRGSRVERVEIDAATARRDNARVAEFDNSMGWIFFEPAGQQSPIPSGTDVPATHEIDWTADDVPCLSETARNEPPGGSTG